MNAKIFICLFGKVLMRELTEENGPNRDKYLASYTHLSYFLLEAYPRVINKKEHLFWRWATHFFLAATQNMMSNLEKNCQIYQLPYLWSWAPQHFVSCIPYAGCWLSPNGDQKLSVSDETCLKYRKQTVNT